MRNPGDAGWTNFYFAKNLQGDVMAVYRSDYDYSTSTYYGTLVAKYTYDPYGQVLTIEDEYTQIHSFDEQADDYITKPFSMVLLGKRIAALLRRSGQSVTPDTMTFGEVTVNFSGYTARDQDGKIDLTPKEIDLLRLFVEHKGLVLSRSQILDALWGDDNPIIDRTVDTYVKNLRKKCRLDCLITVKGIGYKFEVSE